MADIYTTVYCDMCNKEIDLDVHSYNNTYVKINNHVNKCKICKWKIKHKELFPVHGFSEDEVDIFLDFFVYNRSVYLNDISEKLNKNIDDMIKLFRYFKIANRKCLIRCICENCGKYFDKSLASYASSNNHYCCFECYSQDKTNKIAHGEDSQFYNRVTTKCSWCGNVIKIIPTKINKNQYGDNNNFCSRKCYYAFRSKYYVGEKAVRYNKKATKEQLDKMRIAAANKLKNMDQTKTSIQIRINELLDDMSIDYQNEKTFKYYSVDNYLPTNNLVIEVMGDYWHANPMKYNIDNMKINDTQIKDIIKDKRKRTYLSRYHNINILYLWESDIKNNIELCKKLLEYYIFNNGIIENYNSFNWYIDTDNNLKLSSEIIFPYFELNKKYYLKIKKCA